MRANRFLTGLVAVTAALALTACGESSDTESDPATAGSAAASFPVSITHAFGTTTIEKKPERVATVNWANHEVPLALGIVPVGYAKANFGDEDGDGLLPWDAAKLKELGAPTPVLFDETDGIDFEGVANTKPDVILAAYSGLTQQDYDTLSKIAPVVAYPKTAWSTSWRESIQLESKALGLAAEGDKLIGTIEKQMKDEAARYPKLAGKSVMFLTHIDPTDLSKISFYTTHDTRAQFFTDLGMKHPASIEKASAATEEFSLTQSAEQVQNLSDVDIIVTYGDAEGTTLATLQKDPLLSKIPAIARGSFVSLPGSTPVATAANPTPLAVSFVLKDYVDLLGKAADKI
ncbi:iron complex transport system substrate-binding protein [Actinoplanes lutulentus]|uniref:Iron complex transport system substrate-binding protein n=1 Tax=Actinoplanes lutulentus TaxID=1287878 RepID=A0A327ZD65_9ACTN|nr:iron-siderophore ABC transporter substrate-binding protein [Actinoplanes lutulentus]MBB2947392.1 iron complex transport system substrate-binding protein [Actinoplanes lutulentus]RAK36666.1 iron complex transport system substrate-binding protein [Actinoplanes lutulentus]